MAPLNNKDTSKATRDKLRQLKFLMNEYPATNSMSKERIKEMFLTSESSGYKRSEKEYDKIIEMLDIYRLSDELGLSNGERNKLWNDITLRRYKSKESKRDSPPKNYKDNTGVKVGSGSGHSNRNKIRYPSKKRSLRVWKKFYEMFPYNAIQDGWDGKTSKRMK